MPTGVCNAWLPMQCVHFEMRKHDIETNSHDFSNLIRQLGYSGETEDMNFFISTHRLEAGAA